MKGVVVASATVARSGESWVCLYPVRRDAYPAAAAERFTSDVLPRMAAWLTEHQARPDTAIQGTEELVIEWHDRRHHQHQLRHL
jgi:hypothetical protein